MLSLVIRKLDECLKRGVITMMLAALLFCIGPNMVSAQESASEPSGGKSVPCKGLKPYNNLDELLYQFYINLESDCLFAMTTAELEEVWEVKILDEERFKPINYYPLSETEFFNKPYESEKDAFFIVMTENEKYGNRFTLKPTKEYSEKYGRLFAENDLPKTLPLIYVERPYNKIVYEYRSSDNGQVIALNKFGEIEVTKYHGSSVVKNSDDGKRLPKSAVPVDSGEIPCRGLKPFNDINELLYQFYINIDSDCLLKMSADELEKIWDIKILTLEKNSDLRNKPYNSEKDAFYVQLNHWADRPTNEFWIHITNQYYEEHRTLFPDGNYAKMLPEPLVKWNTNSRPGSPGTRTIKGPVRYFISRNIYYWLSSDEKRKIQVGGRSGVESIVYKKTNGHGHEN